jgi:hypothetical protein
MAQVTIYLDPETKEKMKAYTESKNISQSQWVADIIREKLQSEWPNQIAALAGAWEDFPSLEDIRKTSPSDVERESF